MSAIEDGIFDTSNDMNWICDVCHGYAVAFKKPDQFGFVTFDHEQKFPTKTPVGEQGNMRRWVGLGGRQLKMKTWLLCSRCFYEMETTFMKFIEAKRSQENGVHTTK